MLLDTEITVLLLCSAGHGNTGLRLGCSSSWGTSSVRLFSETIPCLRKHKTMLVLAIYFNKTFSFLRVSVLYELGKGLLSTEERWRIVYWQGSWNGVQHCDWPATLTVPNKRLRMINLGKMPEWKWALLPAPCSQCGGLSWVLQWSGYIILSVWTNQPGSCNGTLWAIFSVVLLKQTRLLLCSPASAEPISVLTVRARNCGMP